MHCLRTALRHSNNIRWALPSPSYPLRGKWPSGLDHTRAKDQVRYQRLDCSMILDGLNSQAKSNPALVMCRIGRSVIDSERRFAACTCYIPNCPALRSCFIHWPSWRTTPQSAPASHTSTQWVPLRTGEPKSVSPQHS